MGVKIPRNSLVERLFNVEVSSSNHSVSAGYDLGYLGHKGGGNLGCRIRPYSGLREKIGKRIEEVLWIEALPDSTPSVACCRLS